MTSQFQRRLEKRAAKCAKISANPVGDFDPFPGGILGEVGGVSVLDTLTAGYNPSGPAGPGLTEGKPYTVKVPCLCLEFWKGTGKIKIKIDDIDLSSSTDMAGIVAITSTCSAAVASSAGICLTHAVALCQATASGIFPNHKQETKLTGC